MKKIVYALMGLILMIASCAKDNAVTVTVTEEVVNAGYIGNGVEWDPYDEALAWGYDLTDTEWKTLYERLDVLRPQYVRCMINSPFSYWDAETGTYRKERRPENLKRLLTYCNEHDIKVIYGEYNPPRWDMKESQQWVDASVDYLNYLVMDCGLDCIKHFVIFNEPDGYWASTNGDYALWLGMLKRFHEKMQTYPGLSEKVTLAGPDVVVNYKNDASPYDAMGWVEQSAHDAENILGIYDIHAYPGQHEVRSGEYGTLLRKYVEKVPAGKKIVLGESGFKYDHAEDSLLKKEYLKRVEGHPFTKGSDCNMLCYDYFYGLDMPMLAMEVMNAGLSGVALWMLDDAMHSSGDSGKTEDIKIWGLWNILGSKVFNSPEEERVRPLFYSWAMMCRYFPHGCDILKNDCTAMPEKGIFTVCAVKDGRLSFAAVNVGGEDVTLNVALPQSFEEARLYVYDERVKELRDDLQLLPVQEHLKGNSHQLCVKAQTMVVLTEM